MSEDSFTVKGFQPTAIEGRNYPATITALKKWPSGFGGGDDYVQWFFHPDGFEEDVQVVGSTSMAAGWNAKPMEWTRRILGKSTAVDMRWGKDLREKRPVVDWGPDILVGKRCVVVVEKYFDEGGRRGSQEPRHQRAAPEGGAGRRRRGG